MLDRGFFMYKRHILSKILLALDGSPAVLLVGPRQSGKTTTVKTVSEMNGYDYISFDSITSQASASSDPIGFIDSREKPVILDEVQRVPEIFLPIKVDIDKHRRDNGRYVLTGSANPLLVPKLGDALTGRMIMLEMWPLSQGEVEGVEESFLGRIFSKNFASSSGHSFSRKELLRRVCLGGFPDMVQAKNEENRKMWCDSYLSLAMQKDVLQIAQIEGLTQLPRILQIIATRSGTMLNYSEFSKITGVPLTTLRRYMHLLESLFLIYYVQPWNRNLGKRLTKAPKVYFVDTGVLLHTLDFDQKRLENTPNIFGGVVENFVVNEISKQISWSRKKRVKIYYCRLTDDQTEVDIILEDEEGKIVGIEVKSGETINSSDFKHLKQLKQLVGEDFIRGIVLYSGQEKLPFGDNNWAIPINDLWI